MKNLFFISFISATNNEKIFFSNYKNWQRIYSTYYECSMLVPQNFLRGNSIYSSSFLEPRKKKTFVYKQKYAPWHNSLTVPENMVII